MKQFTLFIITTKLQNFSPQNLSCIQQLCVTGLSVFQNPVTYDIVSQPQWHTLLPTIITQWLPGLTSDDPGQLGHSFSGLYIKQNNTLELIYGFLIFRILLTQLARYHNLEILFKVKKFSWGTKIKHMKSFQQHVASQLNYTPGLKVGRMTRTIWVTWVNFLVGQVGLIHKLNYLDVTRIFNRSHFLQKKTLVSDKQVNLGSSECTEPSLV